MHWILLICLRFLKYFNLSLRNNPRLTHSHFVKSVRDQSFSGPYFPVFGLITEKYGPENIRIRTLFTQWTPQREKIFKSKHLHATKKSNLSGCNTKFYLWFSEFFMKYLTFCPLL